MDQEKKIFMKEVQRREQIDSEEENEIKRKILLSIPEREKKTDNVEIVKERISEEEVIEIIENKVDKKMSLAQLDQKKLVRLSKIELKHKRVEIEKNKVETVKEIELPRNKHERRPSLDQFHTTKPNWDKDKAKLVVSDKSDVVNDVKNVRRIPITSVEDNSDPDFVEEKSNLTFSQLSLSSLN